MGLFSSLTIGTRGLFAAQLGMDVAGQNISNADVEGYSRKRLNMTADYRYDGQFGQMGFGVDVVSIDRLRDTLIDQQIRRQNREVGYFEEIDGTLEQIENIFTEPGETGLLNHIDEFFDSWHELSLDPEDMSARNIVRTNAEILTDVFHSLSGELSDLRSNRNDKIARHVDRVNELTAEVYNLNIEIGAVEIDRQNANDSRDRRDVLLKELSKLIDVDVIENERGMVTVTSAGQMLVSPEGYRRLETTTVTRTDADGANFHELGIRFVDSKKEYTPISGMINGLYKSRDEIIPEYQEQLNELAVALAERVNEQHEQGYNLMGYSGISFFDPSATGASDIAVSAAVRSDLQNLAAATAGEANAAPTNAFAAGALDFGTPPTALSKTNTLPATGTDVARNVVRDSVIVRSGATTLTENVDYHVDYANGTIQMLHGGYDGSPITVDFRYRTGSFSGPGDNANAVAIAALRNELTMAADPLGNYTNTFAQYYSSAVGKMGLDRNEAASNLETREFLVEQYETDQDAISGVSLDEEMAEIIKFQHTFSAAARLISTTDQMLQVLMNM